MPGRSSSSFGLIATYDPEGTTGGTSVTATVLKGSGGETNTSNNTDAEELKYFADIY